LKNALHEAVVDAVAADPEDREILADVNEFVQLQRFFRLALGGRLGPDFPVEKLTQLATDVRAAAEPGTYRTPRWNSRPVPSKCPPIASPPMRSPTCPTRIPSTMAW
jgi:hypothetical protein